MQSCMRGMGLLLELRLSSASISVCNSGKAILWRSGIHSLHHIRLLKGKELDTLCK